MALTPAEFHKRVERSFMKHAADQKLDLTDYRKAHKLACDCLFDELKPHAPPEHHTALQKALEDVHTVQNLAASIRLSGKPVAEKKEEQAFWHVQLRNVQALIDAGGLVQDEKGGAAYDVDQLKKGLEELKKTIDSAGTHPLGREVMEGVLGFTFLSRIRPRLSPAVYAALDHSLKQFQEEAGVLELALKLKRGGKPANGS